MPGMPGPSICSPRGHRCITLNAPLERTAITQGEEREHNLFRWSKGWKNGIRARLAWLNPRLNATSQSHPLSAVVSVSWVTLPTVLSMNSLKQRQRRPQKLQATLSKCGEHRIPFLNITKVLGRTLLALKKSLLLLSPPLLVPALLVPGKSSEAVRIVHTKLGGKVNLERQTLSL